MDTPEKKPCEYCGCSVYYPCSNAATAWAVCCIGESGLLFTGSDKVEGRVGAGETIPSAYSDEAYSQVVYKPHHYAKYKVEPITFIMENDLPYAVGNVIKYVMRYRDKNGLEDLKKARRYIDMIIEKEYGADSV
jgi:Protein of unknwon function (DUF3310)